MQSNDSWNPKRHLFIPDAQVKPGVPIEHLEACGNYIVEKKPDVIINIGDFADMPSLSIYEQKGSKKLEGARYAEDINAAKEAMKALLKPLNDYNKQQKKNKKARYKPRMVLTLGNHENRINRAINTDPVKLEGVISMEDLEYEEFGWETHEFLTIVNVDGILYSHYFVNPASLTGNPVGGTVENKLKLLGKSFSMGHQQTYQHGVYYQADGMPIQGLVAGAFYMHDEDYMGPQKNSQHWRGIVMKNEVHDGCYDICQVSIDFLLRNYL